MRRFQQANQQFCAEKSGNTTGAERETMLKMLAGAHDIFVELRANLQEGTKVRSIFFFEYSYQC